MADKAKEPPCFGAALSFWAFMKKIIYTTMKIYTKQGDEGLTRLGNGTQLPKDSIIFNVLGTIDELNAMLGVVLSSGSNKLLTKIQGQLFQIGADLCMSRTAYGGIKADIEEFEKHIDFLTTMLPPLKNFILPGGTQVSAWLHYARTICRRAEREVVSYFRGLHCEDVPCNKAIIVYLNRLSDLLFTMARYSNDAGEKDVVWTSK